MDLADEANLKEQENRNKALAKTYASLAQTGSKYCIDCGLKIPAKRREVYPAAKRCITCQVEFEEKL